MIKLVACWGASAASVLAPIAAVWYVMVAQLNCECGLRIPACACQPKESK